MRVSRIKKYSKQIVSQDMVISCMVDNVEEIPSIKRGAITSFSYKDQKTRKQGSDRKAESSFSATSLSVRNIHLCGLLTCWHLLNQRGAPTSLEGQESYYTHKKSKVSADKTPCKFRVSLRRREIETAIEKWLFFILPRSFERVENKDKKNLISDRRDNSTQHLDLCARLAMCHKALQMGVQSAQGDKPLHMNGFVKGIEMGAYTSLYSTYLRRDFMSVRSIYFHTALSLPFSNKVSLDRYKNLSVPAQLSRERTSPAFTYNQDRFVTDHYLYARNAQLSRACENTTTQNTNKANIRVYSSNRAESYSSISKMAPVDQSTHVSYADFSTVVQNQLSIFNVANKSNVITLSRKSVCNSVSLHCANVLWVPEMQDLAQSGILVLEGSLSLQLSLR